MEWTCKYIREIIMANNRMFLLHKPSGKAIFLGKRLISGWYDVPERLSEKVQSLFDAAFEATGPDGEDDFCIALEDASSATMADGGWYLLPFDYLDRTRGILGIPEKPKDN